MNSLLDLPSTTLATLEEDILIDTTIMSSRFRLLLFECCFILNVQYNISFFSLVCTIDNTSWHGDSRLSNPRQNKYQATGSELLHISCLQSKHLYLLNIIFHFQSGVAKSGIKRAINACAWIAAVEAFIKDTKYLLYLL